MANPMNAIGAYAPRIVNGRLVDSDELVEHIADRTGLNDGDIAQFLAEMRDAVIRFNRSGHPVRLRGLGIYKPIIALDGSFRVSHRLDSHLRGELNRPGAFRGEVLNRENIGKTLDDLIELWNDEHPGDPILPG